MATTENDSDKESAVEICQDWDKFCDARNEEVHARFHDPLKPSVSTEECARLTRLDVRDIGNFLTRVIHYLDECEKHNTGVCRGTPSAARAGSQRED